MEAVCRLKCIDSLQRSVIHARMLNNPLLWNFAVYAVVMVLLVMRILAEERILMGDPAYDAYSRQVRFRLLPALF